MNIVGKTLVILNLIFALAVGGFLVVDFATRTDWKNSYEKLKQEYDAARSNNRALAGTAANADKREKDLAKLVDDANKRISDLETEYNAFKETKKIELAEEKNRTNDANLKHQQAAEEAKRLGGEVLDLAKTVKVRDKYILDVQEDMKKYLNMAKADEQRARGAQERNEALLAEVMRLNQKIVEMDAGLTNAKVGRDPNQPNPPAVFVKGVIERVDPKDRSLVQISLGTDQGLNKGNTLEAYRTTPKAEYLGMIRIEEAFHHKAIGRLVRNSLNLSRGPLKEGDIVASTLSNR